MSQAFDSHGIGVIGKFICQIGDAQELRLAAAFEHIRVQLWICCDGKLKLQARQIAATCQHGDGEIKKDSLDIGTGIGNSFNWTLWKQENGNSKYHGRDRHEAMRQLEDSLRRLQTDYLDLWQVHELAYDNDPEWHFAPGGVMEAIDQAKREGKVRFVGFTGHKSAEIHLKMLSYGYPFDACQMPLNALDGTFRSFEQKVLPELERQGIAAIGMKSMGGGGDMVKAGVLTAEEALRYVMSLPIASVISGIDSMAILQQNLKVARNFQPFSAEEMQALRARCAPSAADGRYELYKVSARHEGPIGRAQHGFPAYREMRD